MRLERNLGDGALLEVARWMNGCRASIARVCAWSIVLKIERRGGDIEGEGC